MPPGKQQKPSVLSILSTIQSEQNVIVISIEPTFFWSECLQALHCDFVSSCHLESYFELLWKFQLNEILYASFCANDTNKSSVLLLPVLKLEPVPQFSGLHENNTSIACSTGFEKERGNKKTKHGGGLSPIIFVAPVLSVTLSGHFISLKKIKKNLKFIREISYRLKNSLCYFFYILCSYMRFSFGARFTKRS